MTLRLRLVSAGSLSSPARVLVLTQGCLAGPGTPLRASTFAALRRVGKPPRWAEMGTPSHLPGDPAGTFCRRQRTVYAPGLGTQNSLTEYRRTNGELLSTGSSGVAMGGYGSRRYWMPP